MNNETAIFEKSRKERRWLLLLFAAFFSHLFLKFIAMDSIVCAFYNFFFVLFYIFGLAVWIQNKQCEHDYYWFHSRIRLSPKIQFIWIVLLFNFDFFLFLYGWMPHLLELFAQFNCLFFTRYLDFIDGLVCTRNIGE